MEKYKIKHSHYYDFGNTITENRVMKFIEDYE